MSRFKVGQTVYSGRGDKMKTLVVARVIDNHMIPLYQYSFEAPNDGWACGEQSIRSKPDGRDLKISECYKKSFEKNNQAKINVLASAMRNPIDLEPFGLERVFSSTQIDFKPNLDLVKWIKEYAQEKNIFHIGSGQGHLVNMLKMVRARTIGIEPNFNKQEWIKWRMMRDGSNFDINEILSGGVEDYANLIKASGKEKTLLIIARPKVKDFVNTTLSIMPSGMELLYITKDELPFVMNDPYLIEHGKNVKLLSHTGISEDNEFIYSIIKE